MYSVFAKYIMYPIGEAFLGTKMLKYLKELEETQWWPPEKLKDLQNMKLRALINHAYNNIPYYHHVFEERGLNNNDIQTVEDLQRLPILTKNDIRQNFNNLIAKGPKKLKPFLDATGGSMGEPLKFYLDTEVSSISWAGMFRGWGWAGYKLGDKRVTLAGSSLVPNKSPSLLKRLRWLGERDQPFSTVHMDEVILASYAKRITKYKPKFLRGYPSAIYVFANYLNKAGISNITPDGIFTTAEMLLPQHREVIENQFMCKVFDQYGCYDGGPQAMECSEHCGYHISTEKVIMESLGEDNRPVLAGQPGEIVSTDLYNYTMPFIRYAVGDRGIISGEQCLCGRGLPLMKSIEGRTTDLITFSNGVTLFGPALTLVFKDCCIRQYQLIQEAKDKLVIKVIKDEGYSNRDTEHFLGVLRAHAGECIKIETQFVDAIETTKAGKSKFIISNMFR